MLYLFSIINSYRKENIMRVLEAYRSFLAKRLQLVELRSIAEKCLSIFEDSCSIEDIEECVYRDWEKIRRQVTYINYVPVKDYFRRLKNGYINRTEFKKALEPACNAINDALIKLKNETSKYAKEFSDAYKAFFSEGAKNAKACEEKLIYFTLCQPKTKEIIMEFLKL